MNIHTTYSRMLSTIKFGKLLFTWRGSLNIQRRLLPCFTPLESWHSPTTLYWRRQVLKLSPQRGNNNHITKKKYDKTRKTRTNGIPRDFLPCCAIPTLLWNIQSQMAIACFVPRVAVIDIYIGNVSFTQLFTPFCLLLLLFYYLHVKLQFGVRSDFKSLGGLCTERNVQRLKSEF